MVCPILTVTVLIMITDIFLFSSSPGSNAICSRQHLFHTPSTTAKAALHMQAEHKSHTTVQWIAVTVAAMCDRNNDDYSHIAVWTFAAITSRKLCCGHKIRKCACDHMWIFIISSFSVRTSGGNWEREWRGKYRKKNTQQTSKQHHPNETITCSLCAYSLIYCAFLQNDTRPFV